MGVNFGGYNADVGFGAGGLSASAGTPNGQRAEAGLGGTVNGKFERTAHIQTIFPDFKLFNVVM